MSAIFELPVQSEMLSPDEVNDISGCSRKNDQIEWLQRNGWVFIKNKAGAPIIGRLYARMKLAGINPSAILSGASGSGWGMDISKVR